MREALVVAAVFALLFGGGVGVSWRPCMQQLEDAGDDLLFAQMDVSALRKENADLKRIAQLKTGERDRAVTDSDEWRQWYEQAHNDRTELAKQLSIARAELASSNYQRSTQAQELVEIKAAKPAPVLKVSEYQPTKKRKPKVKKRKPVKVVYRWHFF